MMTSYTPRSGLLFPFSGEDLAKGPARLPTAAKQAADLGLVRSAGGGDAQMGFHGRALVRQCAASVRNYMLSRKFTSGSPALECGQTFVSEVLTPRHIDGFEPAQTTPAPRGNRANARLLAELI